MVILDYDKKKHKEIIHACVMALKRGKVVAYPTDTSYGLAVDSGNLKAINGLYKIKERQSGKPVHVIPATFLETKKMVIWSQHVSKLAKRFWPGPLTLVLGLKSKAKGLKKLSAGTGNLGVRLPKNIIALDLAHQLGRAITTTSANPSANLSGGYDSYSAEDVIKQFKKKKYRPDIIINAGKLPKRKPSTLVKLGGAQVVQILRPGPISERQIKKVLGIRY